MKIMCDTNIILDVLLERQSFVEDSCKVLSLCEEQLLEGFVSAYYNVWTLPILY